MVLYASGTMMVVLPHRTDGVSPSGKARDSESLTRGFESLHPSHYVQFESL